MSEEQATLIDVLASEEQYLRWIERFACYRKQPTKAAIADWLHRFKSEHLSIAHKILDAVTIVSEIEIQQGYKDGLSDLPGWNRNATQRKGRWYFVGAGGAGESGPAMLRLFREANSLTSNLWQSFFVNARDLVALNLSALDNVVFVDDFAGTGKQIVDYWVDFLQELLASEAKVYLLLTAITTDAQSKILSKTDLVVKSKMVLEESANIFSEESDLLTQAEKSALDEYGRLAWESNPRGFGSCGLTIVLSHKTPNNSLPILHANHDKWEGPFPRKLIRA